MGRPRRDADTILRPLKAYLHDAYARKALPIAWRSNGTPHVSRTSVRIALGLRHGVLTMEPKVRALIEEFDSLLNPADYPWTPKHALSEAIQADLAGRAKLGKLPMRLGRPHFIDQSALLIELALPKHAFHTKETQAFLRSLERTIAARLDDEGLSPYVARHKRRFDFRAFAEALGAPFVRQLATAFAQTLEDRSDGRQRYNVMRSLLAEIAADRELVDQIRGRRLNAASLEAAVWRWRSQQVADTTKHANGIAGRIQTAISMLEDLAELQVLPAVNRVTKPRNFKRDTQHIPSFGEPRHVKTASANDGSSRQCRERADLEAAEDLAAVKHEGLLKDQIEAIQRRNEERLETVRRSAEDVLLRAISRFREGQSLIRSCSRSGAQIESMLRDAGDLARDRAGTFAILFPRAQKNVALGTLLQFLQYRWGALIPNTKQEEFGPFCALQYAKHGGLHSVQGYLSATRQAVTAALTIYLCDSGANLGTAFALTTSSISPSPIDGHVRFHAPKDRAAGNVVYCDLPQGCDDAAGHRLSTPDAIDALIEMTKPLRIAAPDVAADALFIARGRPSRVAVLTENSARNLYKAMIEDAGLPPSTPAMIRSSVLLREALSSGGGIASAKLLADHGSHAVTALYTERHPVKLLHDLKVQAFQRQFQAVMIHDITDAAAKLGIDPTTAQQRLVEANRNGLGSTCVDRRMPGRRANAEGECIEAESCIRCSHMIVVTHPEVLADLLQWKAVLKAARGEWKRTRPDRWEAVWAPSLDFATIVLSSIERGPHARVLLEAEQIVARRIDDRQAEPKPW